MELDANARAFIERTRSAAMTTLRPDGTPHSVRIGVAMIDGKIWSSSTETRQRTKHLRRDPRSTLFLFDAEWRWLTLECTTHILDGPDVYDQNLRFFQTMQTPGEPGRMTWFGRDVSTDDFMQIMRDERRVMYEFEAVRAYGMYGATP